MWSTIRTMKPHMWISIGIEIPHLMVVTLFEVQLLSTNVDAEKKRVKLWYTLNVVADFFFSFCDLALVEPVKKKYFVIHFSRFIWLNFILLLRSFFFFLLNQVEIVISSNVKKKRSIHLSVDFVRCSLWLLPMEYNKFEIIKSDFFGRLFTCRCQTAHS